MRSRELDLNLVYKYLQEKHNNTNEFISANILDEMVANIEVDLPNEVIKILLQVGLNMYYNLEYSSATAIGIALEQWIENYYTEDFFERYKDKEKIYDQLEDIYIHLEWR